MNRDGSDRETRLLKAQTSLKYLLELPESFKNRSKRKKDDSASKFYQSGKSTTPDRLDQTWMNCVNLFDAEYNV